MTTPTPYHKEVLEEFDNWAENETATFESDGDGEGYNVSYTQLSFYDELREKIAKMLSQAESHAYRRAVADCKRSIGELMFSPKKHLLSGMQEEIIQEALNSLSPEQGESEQV